MPMPSTKLVSAPITSSSQTSVTGDEQQVVDQRAGQPGHRKRAHDQPTPQARSSSTSKRPWPPETHPPAADQRCAGVSWLSTSSASGRAVGRHRFALHHQQQKDQHRESPEIVPALLQHRRHFGSSDARTPDRPFSRQWRPPAGTDRRNTAAPAAPRPARSGSRASRERWPSQTPWSP